MRTKDIYDLPHHPAADLFPMMPDDELQALADDIKKNGQHYRILVIDGQVLDGRNRLVACKLAGVRPSILEDSTVDGKLLGGPEGPVTPTEYVVSLNLRRRHLTGEQRREVIAAVLKANPGKSNRQVAEQVKADDKTVGKVRRELEGRSEIPNVAERTDTRGRQQPATRPARGEDEGLNFRAPPRPGWVVPPEARDPPPAPQGPGKPAGASRERWQRLLTDLHRLLSEATEEQRFVYWADLNDLKQEYPA